MTVKYFKSIFLFIIKCNNYIFIFSKVYVEFPMANYRTSNNDNQCGESNQLVPGNICYGVYVAIKMRTLNFNFKIPLLK